MQGIYSTYEKLLAAATSKYYRSGTEKGILKVSALARGDKEFKEKI